MKTLLTTILLVLGSFAAQAYESPAWACNLSFKGTSQGVKFIYGNYEYNGKGDIYCVSVTGQKAHYPINVTMKAKPLSAQIAFGKMELSGQAVEIALTDKTPESILGTYYVAQAQGSIVGGVGIVTAVRADLPAMALKLSLQFAKGFGINLGLNRMEITLDQERASELNF